MTYIVEERRIEAVTAAYLKGVLKVCRSLWRLPVQTHVVDDAREMLRHMDKLRPSEERDRRPTPDEINRLKAWFGK